MTYAVKEIFYSLQGEGRQTGRPAVFVRFSGCNLWSGREAARLAARCKFCDTDFVGMDGTLGGRYDASGLVEAASSVWRGRGGTPFIICTGGEPALQLDAELISALHGAGFEIAVETNGTLRLPGGLDWVCVSPKAGTTLAITSGDELKVVLPQPGLDLDELETLDFRHFSVQPLEDSAVDENIRVCVAHVLQRPRWTLSLQTHKVLGIR